MADPVETAIGQVTAGQFEPAGIRHRVRVGPKFLYALFNPRDQLHDVSRAFMTFVREGDLPYRRLVLNEHIIDEAATRLKQRTSIQSAIQLLETIDQRNLYRLEHIQDAGFNSAIERFVTWIDFDASFTDFTTVAHMEPMEIDHILTYDTHFDAFDVTTLPYHD